MKLSKNMIFITGQARPLKDDVINNVYQVLSLSLIIDRETNIIVDADCTTVMSLTSNFIKEIIIGRNIITDINDIEHEIRERFFGLIQKPLIVSLKDAYNRYRMICAK